MHERDHFRKFDSGEMEQDHHLFYAHEIAWDSDGTAIISVAPDRRSVIHRECHVEERESESTGAGRADA